MKGSAKRLLSLVTVLAIALSLLPGFALATEEEIPVAEGSATFATDLDALDGKSVLFTPETNGELTVEILSSTPGYSVELFAEGYWEDDRQGSGAGTENFLLTGGTAYEVLLCTYDIEADDYCAGSISYKITFLSNGEGGEEEPEDPSLIPGATPENPVVLGSDPWYYIGAGKTVWYLYDNYQNMMDNSVYSMMLHISSGADYAVAYADENVAVDENGFVNYEMQDTAQAGKYLFSVTNNSDTEKFFSIEVKERPVYFNSGLSLNVGSNRNLQLDTTYPYTLYEFSPANTGIYQIRVTPGRVGEWGTPYNPVDNTPNKTNVLTWTCTAVGQTVMIGFTGAKVVSCTIIRTGDYVPPVEIPWNFYENTYDFSYELDADADIQAVDLTDGGEHTAVLAEDGFYHYGSAEGPLMVADLSGIEIDIKNAYTNGGLRAWLQDENGETISKNDYNAALYAYYNAGLVPVTEELVMMLRELGQANAWWQEEGLIFPGEAPEDLTMAWMQLCGYLVEKKGVTLSGKVTTGAEGDTKVELVSGEEVIATATVSGKEGNYSFENVAAGIYTLKVSKANHAAREYTVTVDAEAVAQDVKIHLLGDLDGNGIVNMGDVGKLYSHVRGTSQITDEYVLLCANVNGGILNMGDTGALYSHVRGTKLLY